MVRFHINLFQIEIYMIKVDNIFVFVVFSSINLDLLDGFLITFNKLCVENNMTYNGPFYLPKNQKQFIFLKPVHIYKSSGTGFDVSTYKRLVIFRCADQVSLNKVVFFLSFLKSRLPLGVCLKETYHF